MSGLLWALLGAVIGIALREVWVIRQTLTDAARKPEPRRPFSIRRQLLSPLGRHTYELLQQPGGWSLVGIDLAHSSGWSLDCKSWGTFDVADPPGSRDNDNELPWLDRFLLWPLVRNLRQRLKYPEIGA